MAHLEWKVKVAGTDRQWKLEIIEQKPNHLIAWRSTIGDKNDGKVMFQPIDGQTKVTWALDHEPPPTGKWSGEIESGRVKK